MSLFSWCTKKDFTIKKIKMAYRHFFHAFKEFINVYSLNDRYVYLKLYPKLNFALTF